MDYESDDTVSVDDVVESNSMEFEAPTISWPKKTTEPTKKYSALLRRNNSSNSLPWMTSNDTLLSSKNK